MACIGTGKLFVNFDELFPLLFQFVFQEVPEYAESVILLGIIQAKNFLGRFRFDMDGILHTQRHIEDASAVHDDGDMYPHSGCTVFGRSRTPAENRFFVLQSVRF